jgi:hypothetical protein
MCHNKADSIKDVIASGHKYVLGSFMIVENIKRKGKPVKAVSSEYIEFCCANVTRRIETNEMNGSTLKTDNAVEITKKKAEGCLHQIVQREIPLFSEEIISVQEMADIVYTKIIEKMELNSRIQMEMINSSGNIVPFNIELLGEYVIKNVI